VQALFGEIQPVEFVGLNDLARPSLVPGSTRDLTQPTGSHHARP